MSQTDLGIGDIICSLYALEAWSRAHQRPRIALYLRDHLDWLQAVDIPNLEVRHYSPKIEPVLRYRLGDSEAQYRQKLRDNHDPKIWYGLKLDGVSPQPPALNPALGRGEPQWPQPYVLLSPFATRFNRSLSVHHWRLLAERLKADGYDVVALDAPDQPERCKPIGVDYYWGQPPAWTLEACHHAALIISNDSALAHIGGLLGVPTLVVLSQQTPGRYFSLTPNQFVTPTQPCVNCRFQPERGYQDICDYGCWALQSISPSAVHAAARRLLTERPAPVQAMR